jgi:hypothetical protein
MPLARYFLFVWRSPARAAICCGCITAEVSSCGDSKCQFVRHPHSYSNASIVMGLIRSNQAPQKGRRSMNFMLLPALETRPSQLPSHNRAMCSGSNESKSGGHNGQFPP